MAIEDIPLFTVTVRDESGNIEKRILEASLSKVHEILDQYEEGPPCDIVIEKMAMYVVEGPVKEVTIHFPAKGT